MCVCSQRLDMERLPASVFERRLLALDEGTFRAFVADLWRASGWRVAVDGRVLTATRDGVQQRLLVLPPRRLFPGLRAVDGPSAGDVVVSPRRIGTAGRLPRGVRGASVTDADDLRDRLCYALDEATRRDLAARYPWIDPDRSRASPSVPLVDVPRGSRSRRRVATALGVVLLASGFLALFGATGGLPAPDGSGPVDATEPASAGVHATIHSAVYDVERTCDRDPREVAVVASDALRGPDLDRGLVVLGEFWNPRHVRGVPADEWNEMMVDEALRAFRTADDVDVGEATVEAGESAPAETGESATVEATAVVNGSRSTYAFGFSYRTEQPYADCWVIDSFGPA